MSFASLPWWAVLGAGLGVALVVVTLYLLRRTPRPAVVSNVGFWLEAMQKAKPRLLASTRIPLWSLLLSLLVALLLVFLLGGPRFGEGVRGTTVVVLSADRSMGAVEAGRTRLDRALDETRAWVDRATAGGQVAVVRAGIRPRVLMPLTDDDADLGRALDGFVLDDGPADLDAAVALADALVQQHGGTGQILVVADRAPEQRSRAPSVLVPVGAGADDLAVESLVARRAPDAVGEYAVRAEVVSHSSRQAHARLVVRDRDVVIVDQALELGPYERRVVRGQGFSSAQAELTATLEEVDIAGSADALGSSDTAYAVAAPLEPLEVLLVTPGNRWLEAALSVHPMARAEVIAPAELGARSAAELLEHDVVILDRVALGPAAEHPALWVLAPPGGAGVEVGERIAQPEVTAALASHAALGGARMEGVSIAHARALVPARSDRVLVRSGDHALVLAREQAGRRLVATGFELADTDLVERPSFPLVAHHTLRWLAARSETPPLARAPGESLAATAGSTVLDPDQEPAVAPAGAVLDTERAGIYHVGERAVAYSGLPTAPLMGPGSATAVSRAGILPPLAVIAAILLLLLVALEWVLLHRGRLS